MDRNELITKPKNQLSSLQIVKNIYITYVCELALVRYFCFIILFSTLVTSLLSVYEANTEKELIKHINEKSNIKHALISYKGVELVFKSLGLLNRYIFCIPVQRVCRMATKNAFAACIKLELSKYSRLGSGEIQTILDRESKAISELIEVSFLNIIPIFFVLLFNSYNLYDQLGATIMLIVIFTIIIYTITTIQIVHWRTRIRHEYNISQQLCSNVLQDALVNHETILAFKKEEFETVRYNKAVTKVEYDCNRIWISLSIMNMVNKLVFAFQLLLVITFSSYRWYTSKLSGPDFALYLATNKILYSNFGQLGFFYSRFTQAILNVRTSFTTLTYRDAGERDITDLKSNIHFRDVSFYYDYNKILESVNFTIQKGEKIAIIGKNGVGKSTIIKMLMKFEPYSGEIYIDDQDLRTLDVAAYRKLISYVPQTSFLFNETVEYNILYGTNNVNLEDAIMICKRIGVHDSIIRLEKGYDTIAEDKGSLLSGGERQKILLVRSVLKNAPIFIMDEPTAALDKYSEEEILKFILEERKDATTIMILHNLELVKLFDKVIHIKDKTCKMVNVDKNNLKTDQLLL